MAQNEFDDRSVTQSHLDLEERVRRRAHELYLSRKDDSGSPLDDWLRAEQEILGGTGEEVQSRATVVGSANGPGVVFDSADDDRPGRGR